MSTVTRPDVSTCRQRSGWNHDTPGLRRLASGFPAVDRLHRLDLGPTFRHTQPIRRSPSLCLQHHDVLTAFQTSYRPTPQLRDVSVRVRPLLYITNLKCYTVGGQPVSSQVSTIRSIATDRSRFAPVFRDLLPLASLVRGKWGRRANQKAIADLRPAL
jgi:hypothetical protein